VFYIATGLLCTVDNSNEEKYHAFGLENIQKFLTNYLKTESLNSLNTFGVLNNIYRFDEGLEDYIKDIKVSLDKEEITSKEKIINMMYSPIKNGGVMNPSYYHL
jgi:hypothetical protein